MNGGKTGNERRKWARLPLAIPVFVRSRDGKGKEFLEFATALNVSAGGMLVAIRRILPAKLRRFSWRFQVLPVAALRPVTTSRRGPFGRRHFEPRRRRLLLARPEVCASAARSQAAVEKLRLQCENVCASPLTTVLRSMPSADYQGLLERLFGKLIPFNRDKLDLSRPRKGQPGCLALRMQGTVLPQIRPKPAMTSSRS